MKTVVEELNDFLKGLYMGIHAYEHYIQKESDANVQEELQRMQQENKINAMKVAERIQDLGGAPVTGEGFIGAIQGYVSNLTTPADTTSMLKNLIKGEGYYGMEVAKDHLVGDLDEESKQLIDSILENERTHVNRLKELLARAEHFRRYPIFGYLFRSFLKFHVS